MRHLRYCLLASMLLVSALPALAFVPQTIVVDGLNDFDPSNVLGDDSNDTQTFCTPPVLPMDLGRVFITNDNNYLYLGIEFARSCFCDMNLGFSIDVNSAAGGTTDPFGRKIGWANLAFKPDFIVYDVTPTSCNTFNYEILYKDSLGTWLNKSTLINPSWGSGSNGLGIVDSLTFKELRLPLSVLGVSAGTPLRLEFWVTQEGTSKGPLDAFASDNVQMSRVGQTTFDTTLVVQMTSQVGYTVQNATDVTAPTVASAQAVNFPLLANKQFSLSTNKVDVAFSEPVDLTTSQVSGNYVFSGPVTRTVISAVRDVAALNVVHLQLNSAISSNAAFHNITVSNVKDMAQNPIVQNGTTNVGSFFIQNLVFNADLSLPLCSGTFAAADTIAVEGNLPPLTFALCDNAVMYDANADSIYNVTVPFCMPKNAGTGRAEADLEWKLTRACSQYESIPGNRTYHLSSDNGASVPLTVAWSNDDPANFTFHPVDVIFQVNAALANPTPADTFYLQGNVVPLSFTPSGLAMRDDGVFPDQVAGDRIYTRRVRFPACAPKNVDWKLYYRGAFECEGQGNRNVWLNDAVFDTVGGALGPITLAARGIQRCTVSDRAVTVLFRVDMTVVSPDPGPADTVAVRGDVAPISFDSDVTAVNRMRDDGVAPDAAAGDHLFTRAVTFPDSTNLSVNFKYFWNGIYECDQLPNRNFRIDDVNYSTSNVQVRPINGWNYCSDPTAVPVAPRTPDATASFAVLRQSFPNPMSPRTTIRFDLKRAGRVSLAVYDVSGRRVATLLERVLPAGPQDVTWDGRDADGQRVRSGIYLYELAMGKERLSRRLVIAR